MEYTEEYFAAHELLRDADRKLQRQNEFFGSDKNTKEEKSDYRSFLVRQAYGAMADISGEYLTAFSKDIRDFYCADKFCSSFEGKAFLQKVKEDGLEIDASKFLNQKAKAIEDKTEYMSNFWKTRDDIVIITKEILEEFQESFEKRFSEEDPEVHFVGIYRAWQNENLGRSGK